MTNGRLMTGLLVIMLALGMFLPAVQVEAQSDAPPVLILPINNADFLPGALFDFRVEVHADAMPDDFAVTVNGVAPADFFGVAGTEESWDFGDEDDPRLSQSVIWRGVSLPAPGDYTVEVTAGGETHTANWTAREPQAGTAKNVILFIADGGNLPFFTATRLVSRGMVDGFYNDHLSWEQFEEIGHLSTSGIDSIITDSANSASAYNNGHKTITNAVGSYPDTSPDTLDDPRTETFAELVKRTRGMSVGIVTTADWSDATPSAVFGHGRDRSSTNRTAYASQPLDEGWMPEVILGGGARYMLPSTADGSRRTDERDMFTEYEQAGYTLVFTAEEMNAALDAGTSHLLGVFHSGDMSVWLDRNVYTDNLGDFADQPGLVDMTMAALSILSTNENGFYLEVEAASVDKQLHPMDFDRALADAIEFDRAIAAAAEWAAENAPDTLIVVTADHAHGFDVWGTVDVEEFNAAQDDVARREAIGIYSTAGFPTYVDEDGDFYPDNWDPSVTLAMGVNNIPTFTENFQVSEVPRTPSLPTDDGLDVDNLEDDPNGITLNSNLPPGSTNGGHTLQDVPVYAHGPGSAYFGRAQENIEVFFGMAYAIGLDPLAEGGMAAAVDSTSPAANAESGTAGVGGIDVTTVVLVIAAFAAGFVVRRKRAEA